MPVPTPALLALFTVAAAGFLAGVRVGLALDGAVLLLAGVDYVLVATRLPRVRRRLPSRLALGESARVELRVVGVRRGATVRMIDDLSSELERVGRDVVNATPSDGVARTSYEIRAVGRGSARVGPLHLRVMGPLRLVRRQARLPVTDTIRVVPGVLELRRLRLHGIRERLRRAGLRRTRQRGEGRTFESLREYVAGDDPRTLDWKATARHGEMLVRQYEAERSQSLVLAIDAGRLMSEAIGEASRLDHALSTALLLADVAAAQGDRVGLFAFADRVQRFLPPSRVSLSSLADALAGVVARPVESSYPLAFTFLGRHLRRRSLLVVFTEIVDASASDALVDQLARTARRHVCIAVALRNPGLDARANAPAASAHDTWVRVAAEEMLQERALAVARMRRAGAFVIDVSPEAAVAEVVDRYLEVKYRGRI